jgi:hypothetical protein
VVVVQFGRAAGGGGGFLLFLLVPMLRVGVLVFRYCRRWCGGDKFCCCRSGFGFSVCVLLFGGGVWLVMV